MPSRSMGLRPKARSTLAAALLLAAGAASAQAHLDNPFAGARTYVNPEYTARAETEAAGEPDAALAARMRLVAQQPTAVTFDRIAAVPSLEAHLDATLAQGANLFLGVLRDLPDRDCAGLVSSGEMSGTLDGLRRYEAEFIDAVAAIAAQPRYAGLRIVFVVEPGSLTSLIVNRNDPRCVALMASQPGAPDGIYVEGVRHAVNTLHALPNVYLYLDAGNSAMLGWADNLTAFVGLLDTTAAGFTARKEAIDGFVDGAAWPLPLKEPFLSAGMIVGGQPIKASRFFDWNDQIDEATYSATLHRSLVAAGWPATLGILLDTSRGGWGGPARPHVPSASSELNTFVDASRVDRRAHRGLWCNPAGAGIGELPAAAPAGWPDQHFDAFVWVKSPGESDGASRIIANDEGKGFDRMCDPTYVTPYGVPTGALPDAPLAGAWFPAAFRTLVENMYPIMASTPTCQHVPSAPTALTAVRTSPTEVRLSWSAAAPPSGCTVTYAVHRGTAVGFTPSASTQVAAGVTGTTYTVTGLALATPHVFLVQAVDAAGAASSAQVLVAALVSEEACASPVTFTGNTGNLGTTGAACFRTRAAIHGWGCYNMDGRTVSVGGRPVACGELPLGASADGYTWFAVSAGEYPWAGIYVW